jgi:betaine-homocysteine S-methyltransferase
MSDRMPLTDRLDAGPVICAEGFLFELERRGYLTAGEFVPEVALEFPDALRALHVDYQRAGSDIVEAFTYNGHREKMRVIGKEDLLEPLNRAALQIAREVADAQPGNLMAGNISNSNIWDPADEQRQGEVRAMFEEMVGWAVEGGADLIIGETFYYAGEALAALEIAKSSGLQVVLTIAPMAANEMADGVGIVETCQRLEQAGADVVGMNCFRGPQTMLPWLREIRAAVSCHVGALPVPYRTTEAEPTFFNLSDPAAIVPSPHGRTFPTALDPLYANRYEIGGFAADAFGIGINYLGVCCGASPMLIRQVAEAVGRTTEASRFSEKMQNHFMYGDNQRLPEHIVALGDRA